MDIRRRLYPHPVLSETTDDFVNSSFSNELQVTRGLREICLSISLRLVNEDTGKAEYVVHIECSYTAYREVIRTDATVIEKHIPENKLNGKVDICVFIVAKINNLKYYSNCFNEEYEGRSFLLQKGGIIAIGTQIKLNITKELEELSKIPSIFTICRCAEDTDESMKIEINGEKIAITLCQRSFSNYKLLAGTPQMLPVLHSMLIVPTLIYTFETLKSIGTDEFEDLRWFKSIARTLRKNNLELNKELLETTRSFELAQKSLDMPIDRALETLINQDSFDEEE